LCGKIEGVLIERRGKMMHIAKGWNGKLVIMDNEVLPKDGLVQFFASGEVYCMGLTNIAIGNVAGRLNRELKTGDTIAESDIEWFNDAAKAMFVGAIIEKDIAEYIKSKD
jgi:hypothetical protein